MKVPQNSILFIFSVILAILLAIPVSLTLCVLTKMYLGWTAGVFAVIFTFIAGHFLAIAEEQIEKRGVDND